MTDLKRLMRTGWVEAVQSRADHVIETNKQLFSSRRCSPSIAEQDKQAWGGRSFEMVSHSTVDVHTRAAVVCTSQWP